MKSDNRRLRNLSFSVFCIQIVVLGVGTGARANPTITVTWDCAGTPADPADYEVFYTDPANPDIELKSECLYWKIKSVDGGSPGDIGEITATGAVNYGLSISDGSGGPGARHVEKIDLHPAEASKYSNLTGGHISGNLSGNLSLQRAEGEQGEGGIASFIIDGDAEGNITIPQVSEFRVYGLVASGVTITIGDLVDVKRLSFSDEFSGTLLFPNGLADAHGAARHVEPTREGHELQ